MICPMGIRGFRELKGSWKITWILRRMGRSSASVISVRSLPSKQMVPAVGFSSWRTHRPVVVFPDPDSPTNPTVSPLRMEKLMPSTALITPITR